MLTYLMILAADAAPAESTNWVAILIPVVLALLNVVQHFLRKRSKDEAGTATSIVRLLIRAIETQGGQAQAPATSQRLKNEISTSARAEGATISKTLHQLVREET